MSNSPRWERRAGKLPPHIQAAIQAKPGFLQPPAQGRAAHVQAALAAHSGSFAAQHRPVAIPPRSVIQNVKKKKQDPWKAFPSVPITSTGLPFYIVESYGTKSYGLGINSTGNKPLAVVCGYYNGQKAEVHVHLKPQGNKYDAHTGAHVKISNGVGGYDYPATWDAGNVSGSADLKAILETNFKAWYQPGSYIDKQSKNWL